MTLDDLKVAVNEMLAEDRSAEEITKLMDIKAILYGELLVVAPRQVLAQRLLNAAG
jgi:hypothetical protein